jgi:hypothetical protein
MSSRSIYLLRVKVTGRRRDGVAQGPPGDAVMLRVLR